MVIRNMRALIDVVLVIGFLVVDFFFFHDMFKPAEVITLPEYLTGALSLLIIISVRSLSRR